MTRYNKSTDLQAEQNTPKKRSTKTVVLVQRFERGKIVSEDRLVYQGTVEAVVRFGDRGKAA